MYKIEYGISENRIKVEIEKGQYLTLGVWSIGSKNFNSERAYRHLNGFQRERPQEQHLSIKEMMQAINRKSTIHWQ